MLITYTWIAYSYTIIGIIHIPYPTFRMSTPKILKCPSWISSVLLSYLRYILYLDTTFFNCFCKQLTHDGTFLVRNSPVSPLCTFRATLTWFRFIFVFMLTHFSLLLFF